MITAILQARLGSSRLPGKVLREVLGRPLLSLMLERVRESKTIQQIVVATTVNPQDEAIARLAEMEGYRVYRGSENDVLDRYYRAAEKFMATTVVRLTADCPLQDPCVIDQIVQAWQGLQPEMDFVGNVHPATFPDGLDTEVFSFEALGRAWRETKIPEEREHVTPYFYAGGKFKTFNVEHSPDLSHHRWTVDYPEDFALVEEVFKALYRPGRIFGMQEVLAFLDNEGRRFVQNTQYARNAWFPSYKRKLEDKEALR